MNRKIVFDFDDAIMESHSNSRSTSTRNKALNRFKSTCAVSDLILAGDKYLANRIPYTARDVIIFLTAVDFEAYQKYTSYLNLNYGLIHQYPSTYLQ